MGTTSYLYDYHGSLDQYDDTDITIVPVELSQVAVGYQHRLSKAHPISYK